MSLSFNPERDRKLDGVRLSIGQRCALGAQRTLPSLSLYSSFSFPTGDSPIRAFVHTWMSASWKKERKRNREERGKERGSERLFWCAFPRDAAPEVRFPCSLSLRLCRFSRDPRPLSPANGPQSATCPCVWTPKKKRCLPTCRTRIAITRSFSRTTSRIFPLPAFYFLCHSCFLSCLYS